MRQDIAVNAFASAPPKVATIEGRQDVLVLELAIILVLIVVNGLLSMSELAIVSSREA